ncbi:MAG: ATP-binding protein [Candidatus Sigynarchaeota archaeon]
MNLLIVDDEIQLCETLGDIFQDKGYIINFAHTARDALKLIDANQFDIGLVDIKLPDDDGLAILHKFKERFPDAVCIIITGYASLQNAIVAMKDGADGYFVKPLNVDEILLVIQSAFEKKRLQKEIRESEARYRIITENSSDLIYIVCGDGLIEYVNAGALLKFLGYRSSEVIGKYLSDMVFEDDSRKLLELFSTCVIDGRGTVEVRFVEKNNNNILWFEITGQKFTGKDNKIKILLICHETTAKKQYEALLKKENTRLQELTEMQNSFVSIATHELRTPLSLVSGAVVFLLENFKHELSPNVLKLVEIISRGATRFKELIDLLVDFSDASADSLKIKLQSADIVFEIHDIVKELESQIARSNINLTLDLPDKLVFAFDPSRIHQTIKHLIVNAIKNSKFGGAIRISVKKQGPDVVCSIQDHGIGFTEEEKALAFKKFGKIFRQKEDYHVDIQGFGLGLYLAKKIVEKHGGMIKLDSDGRNKGSIFTVSLPRRDITT